MRRDLPRHLRAQLALSALNWKYGPEGWRIFATSTGRLQATTISRPAIDYRRGLIPVGVPDAVDADSPRELAAKLRKKTACRSTPACRTRSPANHAKTTPAMKGTPR